MGIKFFYMKWVDAELIFMSQLLRIKWYKYLIKLLLALIMVMVMFLQPISSYAIEFSKDQVNILSKYSKDNPLTKISHDKATVGVIPYYIWNKEIYILLGRERIDGGSLEKSGKFSDFGGNSKNDGTTILQNITRELKEETISKINIKENEILDKGLLLYKVSPSGREIFYVFLPMSDEQYSNTTDLNALRKSIDPLTVTPAYLEKDQFLWLNFKQLLEYVQKNEKDDKPILSISDIKGNTHKIELRKFFYNDCLRNPAFNDLAIKLEQEIKQKNDLITSNILYIPDPHIQGEESNIDIIQ